MRLCVRMCACLCVHAYFYSVRVSSREATEGEMGEGGKSERLQCWNHVIAMAVESGLGGLRLSEYTADEREKDRNEKERIKEADRGEVQIRPDERQSRMTL